MSNPSLREEPIGTRATVIPTGDTLSILDWLKKEGRLIDQPVETSFSTLEEEDISLLIGDEPTDDSYSNDNDFSDED